MTPRIRLSMLAATALALSGPVQAGPASDGASAYSGRWTSDERRWPFTKRGQPYKTIDIAPCGSGFCGVSVNDRGKCGPILFRFAEGDFRNGAVSSHAKWGDAQETLVLWDLTDVDGLKGRHIGLNVGQRASFSSRSVSMPMFHATYRSLGGARCAGR